MPHAGHRRALGADAAPVAQTPCSNTLLLHGQVFSPPFKITAIGEPTAMHRALESAEGVRQFRDAVADFGLGYSETVERNVTVRAYDGSSDLRSAQVAK